MLRVIAALVLSTSVLAAQGDPGGGSGAPSGGGPPAAKSLFEQFNDALKLDAKTQMPAVQTIMTAAATEAEPVAQEMLTLRERIMNAELGGHPEVATAALATYSAAAARMAAIEARAFAKVYPLLKPNQQSKAVQAFDLMGGAFLPGMPASRGGRPPGGGRQ